MMTRKINQLGFNLVKEFEGCRLTAYKCPAGVWTIGYGHTGGVKEGDKISLMDAELYLAHDLERFENGVVAWSEKFDYLLNDNEFSALVSFSFNCGLGNLTKLSNSGKRSKEQMMKSIMNYNKANGKELVGLTRRRQREKDLFLTPVTKGSDSNDYKYFDVPTIDSCSIIEMLSNIGVDYSYQYRKSIAKVNCISNYTGTAMQNLKMIDLLKKHALIKP